MIYIESEDKVVNNEEIKKFYQCVESQENKCLNIKEHIWNIIWREKQRSTQKHFSFN